MVAVFRWLVLLVVLFGNIVFWIHWFNRINSTGVARWQIKLIEKLVVMACFLIPGLIAWQTQFWLVEWLTGADRQEHLLAGRSDAPFSILVFAVVAIGALLWHGPIWLLGRFRLKVPPSALLQTTSVQVDLRRTYGDEIFSKTWVRALGRFPGNQLHLMETTNHEIKVERLAACHDGLKLGHFSDVHLTGFMHFNFYREAVDRLMSTKPDVVLLTGDLIDYDKCLDQVQPLLEPVAAKFGCYFVLGNHDRRLKDVPRLRRMLAELGWHDLGAQSRTVEFAGEKIYLAGNERPWFDNPSRKEQETASVEERQQASLRIGLSHSPDQVQWARKLGLDLLFCGHTHGGQVRLPWIGPVVAPSCYGSRFASGWFHCPPTLMHVSRGISGTHPLRIACPPEVSSIVLRKHKTTDK